MERNIIQKLINVRNDLEKESLLNEIKEEKETLKSLKNGDSLIRQAIIDFFEVYNPLNPEWKNKNICDFSTELISFYDNKENIASEILNTMETKFTNPSAYKILLSFEQKIKIEKADLECFFKLILLTKNKEKILYEIKNYFSLKDENFENKFNKIDLESPYAHVLLRNLIENLIIEEKKLDKQSIEKIYKNQVAKIKGYYNFLCPKCLQFLFVRYSNGAFNAICRNGHDYSNNIKNVNKLKFLSYFIITCKTCNVALEMFEYNYHCFQCENFFCEKCIEKHKNNCVNFSISKMYECGFVCRNHNKKFISICAICEKNLCELCKEYHYHRIPEVDYYNIENIINSNKGLVFAQGLEDPKKLILQKLIQSYEFFVNYYNIPWFFVQSIFYTVNDIDLEISNTDFFFESFYDNNFISYYSKLIKQMEKGDMHSINTLREIRNKYIENKIEINNSFETVLNSSLNIALEKSSQMIMHLFNLNQRLKSLNDIIKENEMKYGYISTLDNKINKLETKIELYKSKILSLFNTTNKYKQGLKLLFDRHLSDVIIRILIKKYTKFFYPIQLDFKIAHELIYYFKIKQETNNIIELNQKIRESQILSETNEIEEVKNAENDEIKYIDNKIKFNSNINIGNVFISQTQLNFLLELFFYTKSKGNQIGHPNIEPTKNIGIKQEKKDFNSVENIFDNIHINEINYLKENDLEKNINKNVKNEMEKIKDKFIGNFIDLKTKNKLNISEIMDFMFKGKIGAIWLEDSMFLRTMLIDIDEIINESCDIELSSIRIEFRKIEEAEKVIERLNKENILGNFMLDINTKEFINLKYLIINEFNRIQEDNRYDSKIPLLKIVDYPKFINDIYYKTIDAKFTNIYTEHEYMELINHISIPFIISIERKNLEILKSNLINKFQEEMILLNIKNKTKKIFQLIEKYFNQDEINENYISEVQKFCSEKKDDNYNDIIQLKININSVIYFIENLIGSEDISWLKNDKEKGRFSYDTLLYYYQNYNSSD